MFSIQVLVVAAMVASVATAAFFTPYAYPMIPVALAASGLVLRRSNREVALLFFLGAAGSFLFFAYWFFVGGFCTYNIPGDCT